MISNFIKHIFSPVDRQSGKKKITSVLEPMIVLPMIVLHSVTFKRDVA